VEWRSHLANTLGREVLVGYRLNVTLGRTMPTHDFVCELTVPGGVERAWIGVDSLRRSSAEVSVDGEVVRAVWHAGYTGDREIFIIPSDPMEEVTTHLHGLATHGDQTGELIVPEHRDPRPGATRTPLARAQVGNRWVVLTYGIGLVPPDVGEAVDGYDAEVRGALEALGYLGGKDAPPPAGTEGSDEVPPAEGTDEVPPADSDSDEHPASGASSGPE